MSEGTGRMNPSRIARGFLLGIVPTIAILVVTLSIMGFALANNRFLIISAAYLVSIVAVIIYQVPWRDWVLGVG